MSRSERLLLLLDVLRRHRRPVSGKVLADETGVSLRTLYRDIASLQAQGATIEGEAGVGYVLKPGFLLPPLMFSAEEMEAVMLGMKWVADRGDGALSAAARAALARIRAVVPLDMDPDPHAAALLVGPSAPLPVQQVDLALLRTAIRRERKLSIAYCDAALVPTNRVIWPFALAYFDHARVLLGWCELRADFRTFRADRILEAQVEEERYPRRRHVLLREWRAREGISPTSGEKPLLPETDSRLP